MQSAVLTRRDASAAPTFPTQGAKHFKDIQYAQGVTYGEMFLQSEYEMSGEQGLGRWRGCQWVGRAPVGGCGCTGCCLGGIMAVCRASHGQRSKLPAKSSCDCFACLWHLPFFTTLMHCLYRRSVQPG